MPPSKTARPPVPPHPLSNEEVSVIRETIKQFYGAAAIVRNFGPDRQRLKLHVELQARPPIFARDKVLGLLNRDIARDRIDLIESIYGEPVRGEAKIAYRQGVIV
jgi:hypothetical protein